MVLQAACGQQVDSRNKAVRLTANKLFSERHLQPPIQAFAQQMLAQLSVKTETTTSSIAVAPTDSAQQYISEEDGSRFSELYCALCTKDPKLLRQLLRVYGGAAPGCQKAVEGVASGLSLADDRCHAYFACGYNTKFVTGSCCASAHATYPHLPHV